MDILDKHRGIAETWIKLEKYLSEFQTEEEAKRKDRMEGKMKQNLDNRSLRPTTAFSIDPIRPGTAKAIAPNNRQSIGHRCMDLMLKIARPQTAINYGGKPARAFSAFSQNRPISAVNAMKATRGLNVQDYTKQINHLTLDQILAIYEAKCADNDVDYMGIQAKYFVDKISEKCKNREFNLVEQNLSLNTAKVVSELISKNTHFVKLNLSRNLLKDEGAYFIAERLKKDTNIIHLDLSSNCLTKKGVKYLCDMLLTNITLISLNIKSYEGLNRNKLGTTGVIPIKEMLLKNKTLMYLSIASTQIGLGGFKHLSEGLKRNKTLISLDISNNYFGQQVTKYLMMCLPMSNIQILNLSRCKLGDQGVSNLSSIFSSINPNKVKRLNLSGNNFTCKGFSAFMEGLRTNKMIEELNVDHNNLMGKLITCLTQFFFENTSLRILSMNRCSLEEYAGDALKQGLMRNQVITHLHLNENNLYDEGFSAICEALTTNVSLKILDVMDNNIRDRGGNSFGTILKRNRGLQSINLGSNTITDISAPIIVEGVMANMVIKKIKLRMNPLSFKYITEINTILETHSQQKFKNLRPKIENKISLLRGFEDKKDEVSKNLKLKQENLQQETTVFKRREAEIKRLEIEEMAITQEVMDELNHGMKINSNIEEEHHYLELEIKEYKKGMGVRIHQKGIEENDIKSEMDNLSIKIGEIKFDIDSYRRAMKSKKDDLKFELTLLKREIDNIEDSIAENQMKYDIQTGKKPKTTEKDQQKVDKDAKKAPNKNVEETKKNELKPASPANVPINVEGTEKPKKSGKKGKKKGKKTGKKDNK